MQLNSTPGRPGTVVPWVIAALASIVALGAVAYVANSRRPEPSRDGAVLAQLTQRLDALEAGREGGGRRFIGGQPLPGGVDQMGSSPAKAGLPPQAQAAQSRDRLRALESRFAQQPPDPAAAHIEDEMLRGMIDEQLTASGIVPRNPRVDCRRGVCRVIADFTSQGDASEWALQYVTLLGPSVSRNAQPTFVTNVDGSTQMHLFANR